MKVKIKLGKIEPHQIHMQCFYWGFDHAIIVVVLNLP